MNAEVIKAMAPKKEKTSNKINAWWKKNGYKVARIVLFPIWFAMCLNDKYKNWVFRRNKWDESRAKEILDYYVPRYSDWDENKKYFYFFDNGYGWSYYYAKKHLKRKDRNFWKSNVGIWGGNIRDYLLDSFELEGFTKEIIDQSDSRTEIIFTLKG